MSENSNETLYEVIQKVKTQAKQTRRPLRQPIKMNNNHINQTVRSFTLNSNIPHGQRKYDAIDYKLQNGENGQVRMIDLKGDQKHLEQIERQFEKAPVQTVNQLQQDPQYQEYLKPIRLIDAIRQSTNGLPYSYNEEHLKEPLQQYNILEKENGKSEITYQLEQDNENIVYSAHVTEEGNINEQDRDRYLDGVEEEETETISEMKGLIVEHHALELEYE